MTVFDIITSLNHQLRDGKIDLDTKVLFDVDGRITDDFEFTDVREADQSLLDNIEKLQNVTNAPALGEKILLI